MSQYDRIYSIMSEMVWTIGGKIAGARKFNPKVLKGITRGDTGGRGSAQRATVKTAGSMAREIEDINVSPVKTEVGPWNQKAKRTLTTQMRKQRGAQNIRGLPSGGDVSVPVEEPQGDTPPSTGKRKRGTPRALLSPFRPRGSSGKRAGRVRDDK